MRVVGSIILGLALCELGAPASAAPSLPESGSAKLAAYQVCHPLAVVDMGPAGSATSTECNGIVRNLSADKTPDNFAIRCLENTSSGSDGYKYTGACVQTDGDGDKIFMSYEGKKGGEFKWIGGTGKYKDVAGSGSLEVLVAPSSGEKMFAYTLNFNVTWTNKAK